MSCCISTIQNIIVFVHLSLKILCASDVIKIIRSIKSIFKKILDKYIRILETANCHECLSLPFGALVMLSPPSAFIGGFYAVTCDRVFFVRISLKRIIFSGKSARTEGDVFHAMIISRYYPLQKIHE